MTDTKAPLQRLVDLAIYAPLGLLSVAQKELPQLIATGKDRLDNQLTLARFVGQLAVKKGRRELERRLDAAEQARRGDAQVAPAVADDAPAHDLSGSLPEIIVEAVAEELEQEEALDDAPVADTLPIEGYDSLAASQVVLRLGSLTPAELDAVHSYELNHRNRRTILGKIAQLQAS